MIRIVCEGVMDITDLIGLVKEKYSNDYRRIWSLKEKEIGVFLHEHLGIIAGNVYSIMTLIDFDKSMKTCEISIRYVGGAISLIGIGRSEDFISTMTNDIAEFADGKGWTYEIKKAKVKPAGSKCPYCGAAYRYSEKKRREDGSVDCQNCGKSFLPE